MPNWCTNVLVIEGEADEIKQFRSVWSNAEYPLFNDFVPIPQEEQENWYDWNIENWGTKWDLTEDTVVIEESDSRLRLEFNTAWAPPTQWLTSVAQKYPDLTFVVSYYEEGVGFAGFAVFREGVKISDVIFELGDLDEYESHYNNQEYTEDAKAAWDSPSILRESRGDIEDSDIEGGDT